MVFEDWDSLLENVRLKYKLKLFAGDSYQSYFRAGEEHECKVCLLGVAAPDDWWDDDRSMEDISRNFDIPMEILYCAEDHFTLVCFSLDGEGQWNKYALDFWEAAYERHVRNIPYEDYDDCHRMSPSQFMKYMQGEKTNVE